MLPNGVADGYNPITKVKTTRVGSKTYDGNYNKTSLEIACSSSFNVSTISHIDFPITLYMNISIRNLEYREENYINKYFPISQYRIPIKSN